VPPGFDADLDRATLAWAFISTGFLLPRILAGTDSSRDDRIPRRRAMLQHRLTTAPGTGPLADLAAEIADALRREYGRPPPSPRPRLPLTRLTRPRGRSAGGPAPG